MTITVYPITTNLVIPGSFNYGPGYYTLNLPGLGVGHTGDINLSIPALKANVAPPNTSIKQTSAYFAASQRFILTATGLKPSTVHTFTFDNIDVSANCQPYGGVKGSPLTSSDNGRLTFNFYYNSGLPSTYTDVTAAQDMINRHAGTKNGHLSNSDGSSTADVTIKFISQEAKDIEPDRGPTIPIGPNTYYLIAGIGGLGGGIGGIGAIGGIGF